MVTSLQYTAVEGLGSYLTRGSGLLTEFPLTVPKPVPSLSKTLIGVSPSHRIVYPDGCGCRVGLWASPVFELRCDVYLCLAADPAAVENGQMVLL